MKSKNIFWVLAASFILSFITAGETGAQELKFDGYINSGIGIYTTDQSGDDAQVMIYGVDSERNIGRFRLNGAYTNGAGNAGANFRFQMQGTGASVTSGNTSPTAINEHTHNSSLPMNFLSVPFAYGWVKPFEMLNIKFGLVDDSTWAAADVLFNDDQGEGAGILARITPISGLDLGVGAYIAGNNSGGTNNVFLSTAIAKTFSDTKFTFNLAYTMDKTFRFMASYRTENAIGGNAYTGTPQMLIEFRLLAVDNLTFVVVGQLDKLDGDFSDNGVINIYETIGYKTGDLGFGLNAAQYMDNSKEDTSLLFNPWVSYSFIEGKIVPRLDLVYFLGGTQNGTNYHRKAWTPAYNNDVYVFNVRPSVKINLDSRNSLEIGDAVFYQDNNGTKLTNVFYLDFIVRF